LLAGLLAGGFTAPHTPGEVCLFGDLRLIVDELQASIGENGVDVGELVEATVDEITQELFALRPYPQRAIEPRSSSVERWTTAPVIVSSEL
jgi:hypothetical protein